MKTSSAKSGLKPYNKYRQAKTPFEYLIQRIFIDMNEKDPCWQFTGSKDKNGYGQCHDAKTAKELGVTRAHQMSYKTFNGEIPNGMFVCHKCDNPSCVNPKHLFLGSAKDNSDDMWSKGRGRSGSKTTYDTEYILSQYGKKSSMSLARELGCSFSRICQVWRANGKKGRQFYKGDQRSKP